MLLQLMPMVASTFLLATPTKIFIPVAPLEDCPPIAFCNFNNEEVSQGSPRLLTEEQYAKASASRKATADPADDSEHATA